MHPHLHQVFPARVPCLFLSPEGLIAASARPQPLVGASDEANLC